nr:Chain C, 9-mer peptide from the HCoV spike protein [Severe acute respiratory syndrome coronavirus 2]8HN4_E Chain E, SARS-CoV-2 T-cell epitope QYIKWPWYI [Severe acute respiratory syndrome coronavirus 2]
QYIKWPWYI